MRPRAWKGPRSDRSACWFTDVIATRRRRRGSAGDRYVVGVQEDSEHPIQLHERLIIIHDGLILSQLRRGQIGLEREYLEGGAHAVLVLLLLGGELFRLQ